MKNLTKMQIETAQQVLNEILKDKIKEIAEKNHKENMNKWTKDIKEIQKDRKNLLKRIKKLDKEIKTEKKLEINTEYNSLLNVLEQWENSLKNWEDHKYDPNSNEISWRNDRKGYIETRYDRIRYQKEFGIW